MKLIKTRAGPALRLTACSGLYPTAKASSLFITYGANSANRAPHMHVPFDGTVLNFTS